MKTDEARDSRIAHLYEQTSELRTRMDRVEEFLGHVKGAAVILFLAFFAFTFAKAYF